MTRATLPGWRTMSLGEAMDFKNGLNKAKMFFGKGTPIVNFMDVLSNVVLTRARVRGRVTVTADEIRRFSARRGDVFFTRTSESVDEIGTPSVLTEDIPNAVFSGFVLRGRPRNRDLDPTFLAYALRSAPVRRQVARQATYTTRALTNGKALSRVTVELPSRDEQKQIGTVLSDADRSIESLESLIAKKEAIKRGMMQQLLTAEVRLPGFDQAWTRLRLSELLTVRHGRNQKEVEVESGAYPILATGGEIGRTDTPIYSKPSVLIGRKGTIDRPLFQERPFWTVDTLFYTEIDPAAADPRFLFYVCCMIDWRSMSEASGVPSLSANRIESVECWLPRVDEQKAIGGILRLVDDEIDALRTSVVKARAIKRGMMQELLTGRTRLPVSAPVAA